MLRPFWQFVVKPPLQWHPMVVHFPIALLVAETALLIAARIKRRPELERLAVASLHVAFWSMLVAVAFGLHDSGLDLGEGSKFALGIDDRWKNRFRWQSSITIHVWLALGLFALTGVRAAWTCRRRKEAARPVGWLRIAVAACGLWLLAAASYVGGHVSHK